MLVCIRFRFVGRATFRAFKYRPQALQIIAPVGDRRHSGVLFVPQLLQECPRKEVSFWDLGDVLSASVFEADSVDGSVGRSES